MKRVLSLILAGLLAFAPAARAADVKPLVNASGAIRPVHAGETVGVANGGTGAVTLTSHCVLIGLGTAAVHFACPSSSGQVLTDNGASSDPTFQAAAGGSGTVTTTGSPASGNLTKFSGSTSITNGDLSGDISTSGALATTIGALKITTAMIQASAVTLAKLANIADQTILGNNTGGSAAPLALTAAQTRTVLALAPSATTDTTIASNISSGTLAAARLPLATSSSFGVVEPDNVTTTITAGVMSAVAGGTIQNTGAIDIQWFGDGSDGTVSVTTPISLTRDMYYASLTLSGSGAITTNGWRIYVSGTLDLTAAGAGAIKYDGSNGNGTTGGNLGGGAISALVSNMVGGTAGASGGGASGGTGAGSQGGQGSGTVAYGGAAGAGGAGGAVGATAGGASRAGGAVGGIQDIRRLVSELRQYHAGSVALEFMQGGVPGSGGSAGAGDGVGSGGGGGGGAQGGGVLYVAARTISRGGSTVAGAIQAIGGNGAIGGIGTGGTNRGGGGGAGGGGGGYIYVLYRVLTGSTATNMLDATGGNGGAGANGTGTGVGGDSGGAGGGGRIDVYDLGLGTQVITASTAAAAGNAHSGITGGATKTATAQQVSL